MLYVPTIGSTGSIHSAGDSPRSHPSTTPAHDSPDRDSASVLHSADSSFSEGRASVDKMPTPSGLPPTHLTTSNHVADKLAVGTTPGSHKRRPSPVPTTLDLQTLQETWHIIRSGEGGTEIFLPEMLLSLSEKSQICEIYG